MDGTCLTLLSAMAVAVLGMAAFVKKLYGDLKEANAARAKTVEDMLALVVTMKKEVGEPEGNP